jgi:hypothetical protein
METPNNDAGKLTERIMRIFWTDGIIPLPVAQYNKAYSHVYNVLSSWAAIREGREQ